MYLEKYHSLGNFGTTALLPISCACTRMTLLFTCGAGLVLEERDDKLRVFTTDIDSTQLAAVMNRTTLAH